MHAEFSRNCNSDARKLLQLRRSTCQAPYSQFSTGNIDTLREGPAGAGVDMAAQLRSLWDSRYGAGGRLGLVGGHGGCAGHGTQGASPHCMCTKPALRQSLCTAPPVYVYSMSSIHACTEHCISGDTDQGMTGVPPGPDASTNMDEAGIEPAACCMQSSHSTPELHAHVWMPPMWRTKTVPHAEPQSGQWSLANWARHARGCQKLPRTRTCTRLTCAAAAHMAGRAWHCGKCTAVPPLSQKQYQPARHPQQRMGACAPLACRRRRHCRGGGPPGPGPAGGPGEGQLWGGEAKGQRAGQVGGGQGVSTRPSCALQQGSVWLREWCTMRVPCS